MGAKMYDGQLARDLNIQTKSKYYNENTALLEVASPRREDYLKVFRIMDEQDAINRYHWFNVPAELSSQEIERMIYYRGQLCFFYYEAAEKFYFMPYALDGDLDFYGRYKTIHPVPLCSAEDSKFENQKKLLSELKLKCYYDVVMEDEITDEEAINACVLLHDYCKQRSENIIPRQALNEAILNSMADILSYFDTAALTGCGIEGYKVDNASAKDEVKYLSRSIYKSAINKTPYIPVLSTTGIQFQELSSGSGKYGVQEYLMAFQGVDNLRLSTYGISNGGVYEKQAHILEKEMEINNSNVYSPLQDGLLIRQRFCNIVNSIFGTEMWVEPSEATLKQDVNGDGFDYDREVDLGEEGEQENAE